MALTRFRSALTAAMLALVLAPTILVQGPTAATPPGPYILTDLGTLGGTSAQAQEINGTGQVVGYSTTTLASQARAFLWQNGTMTNLGTLGGSASFANGINSFGQVAGSSTLVPGGFAQRAVLWDGSSMTNLTPDLPSSSASAAYAVNDARHVVGVISSSFPAPFVWRNGVVKQLDDLHGGGGYAYDVNNNGQVVGSAFSADLTPLGAMQHAVLWQNDVISDLGLLPGDQDSAAVAINSFGQIAGSSGRTDPDTYESTYRAFVYSGGVMTPIPAPSSEAYASDINDAGVVVGTMRAGGGFSTFHAWIYSDGVVTNLNTLIPPAGLHLMAANGINDGGQITGVAIDAQGRSHAFLLTPGVEENPVIYANIGDADLAEGNSGARPFTFTVTLFPAPKQPVTVSFATGVTGGSATAGVDYQATSGTLRFAAGQTAAVISVPVIGDRKRESDESFFVTLTGAQGAVTVDNRGVGMIRNDDR
jgi:probable HAF family extracellular repeat protein